MRICTWLVDHGCMHCHSCISIQNMIIPVHDNQRNLTTTKHSTEWKHNNQQVPRTKHIDQNKLKSHSLSKYQISFTKLWGYAGHINYLLRGHPRQLHLLSFFSTKQ
jgi:hypothetical protein